MTSTTKTTTTTTTSTSAILTTITSSSNTIITTTESIITATSPSTCCSTTRHMYGSLISEQLQQEQQYCLKSIDKSVMLVSSMSPSTITSKLNLHKCFSSTVLPFSSPFFNSCQMTAMALAPTLSVISSVSSLI